MPVIIRTYALLIAQVIAGLVILVALQQLKFSSRVNTALIFTFFLLLNLLYIRFFRLQKAAKAYWSLRKLQQLLAGCAAGLLLVLFPLIAAIAGGRIVASAINIGNVTTVSVILTFLITTWEELWFRSLLLNYANRYLSQVNISIAMGFLFTLIHLLNPNIKLLENGPVLFLAGTLLTALYFHYGNIWLPIGVHFGNNFFGSLISSPVTGDKAFGSEGYFYSGLLLTATIYFLIQLAKRHQNIKDRVV